MPTPFSDRTDAGRRLAQAMVDYRGSDAIVLGLARGGVVVGKAVADVLHLPLGALVVRKLGAPANPELAIGAVSETGVKWIDLELAGATGATQQYIDQEVVDQVAEARRRQREYAVGPGLSAVLGRPAIVVDDGIATGATALVAVQSARDLGASTIILATPVASPQAEHLLGPHVDRMVVLQTPDPFLAVGMHYLHFDQVIDSEVVRTLQQANRATNRSP